MENYRFIIEIGDLHFIFKTLVLFNRIVLLKVDSEMSQL